MLDQNRGAGAGERPARAVSKRLDGRRVCEAFVAAAMLLLLLPLLLTIAIVIRCSAGGPVLLRQTRPGQWGRPFVLLKFRTMRPVDPDAGLVSDADRLTDLGRFLRASSLDELPTLWNVVRGDMSLVGPRPLLMEYLNRYTPAQRRRHEVRPGITGLAQVRGRNTLTWEEKFELDVWYVDNRSVGLDLRILAKTVLVVLRRDGITARGSVTAHEFMGSRPAQLSEVAR